MRISRLSAALSLMLTMGGCGASNNPGGGSGSSAGSGSEVSSMPSAPVPDSAMSTSVPPAMRPNQVRPDSSVIELRPVRWTNATAAPGHQLEISFVATGRMECSTLGRVDVVETAQSITVTVLLGRLPSAHCDGIQPQLAAPMATVVTLRDPVGNRPVQDGAAG